MLCHRSHDVKKQFVYYSSFLYTPYLVQKAYYCAVPINIKKIVTKLSKINRESVNTIKYI
jgi:hypothetical protein